MERKVINSHEAPVAAGGYSQAIEVVDAKRLLFISGQIPETLDGSIPSTFEEQAKLAWSNVEAQLKKAGMSFDNLVKVTIIVPDRKHIKENRIIRNAVLGQRQPAVTLLIAGIYDERWLIEIEASAAG
jgi:2-iminobutanoate/2-iminopropanoate deaminase